MTAARSASPTDLGAVFDRYSAAWAARDPERIAQAHHPDTTFWLHNGEAAVRGRSQVRDRFAALFEQYPEFGFDPHRVLFGDGHWVLDWAMTCVLPDAAGSARPLRWDCLDVVTVDGSGLVLRKDTYVDAAQAAAMVASLA